jgi:hypothetical protein
LETLLSSELIKMATSRILAATFAFSDTTVMSEADYESAVQSGRAELHSTAIYRTVRRLTWCVQSRPRTMGASQ